MADAEGSSFNTSFLVPFEREDIYREVIKAQNPLGIDAKRVNIKVTKNGRCASLFGAQ